jgi:hypothetical protein
MTIAALTTMVVAAMYNIIASCFFRGVRIGEVMRYALSFSKASLAFYPLELARLL